MRYEEAKDLFETARNKDAGKPLSGAATRLHKVGDNYAVRYHSTDVVTIHPDGTYTLDLGGWNTLTTRKKMTEFSPARVSTKNHVAFVWWKNDDGEFSVPFSDTIAVDRFGRAISEPPDMDKHKTLSKQLDKMISQYLKGFVSHILENGLEAPDSGDCWYCLMFDKREDGSVVPTADHILSHMSDEERYYVPSLLVNAMLWRRRGNSNPQHAASFSYRYLASMASRGSGQTASYLTGELRPYINSIRADLIKNMKEEA